MGTIALLVANGFEQAELTAIARAMAEAGHRTRLVSTKKHEVRAWDHARWGGDLPVEVAAAEARSADYDALAIPGGVLSADTLRADAAVVALVAEAASLGRPVAATGHAPWVLIEAGLARGRAVTSHPAIRTDLVNAGARWRDEPAVAEAGVITGRHGHDLPVLTALLAMALPA